MQGEILETVRKTASRGRLITFNRRRASNPTSRTGNRARRSPAKAAYLDPARRMKVKMAAVAKPATIALRSQMPRLIGSDGSGVVHAVYLLD